MKTLQDVTLDRIGHWLDHYLTKNVSAGNAYGERITKAAQLVREDKVKKIAAHEYEVQSGATKGTVYHVNGACSCPDGRPQQDGTTRAPNGYCKHKIAVRIRQCVDQDLKELTDKHVQHRHVWDCEIHRDLDLECWQRACGDPLKLVCPTCTTIPPSDAKLMAELDALEEAPVEMPPEPETSGPLAPAAELPPLIYTVPQYEPAPCIERQADPLPEAAASLNIKVRSESGEIMFTMRAHTDNEVLERLPNVLATLERILHAEVDHDASFFQRLASAFFPRKKYVNGK